MRLRGFEVAKDESVRIIVKNTPKNSYFHEIISQKTILFVILHPKKIHNYVYYELWNHLIYSHNNHLKTL